MSWTITVPRGPQGKLRERAELAAKTYLQTYVAGSFSTGNDQQKAAELDAVEDQIEHAIDAAVLLAPFVQPKKDQWIAVSMNGHANPEVRANQEWGGDSVSLSLSQIAGPPAPTE